VDQFVGLRITGGLLPADLPSQLSVGHDPSGKVLSPKDYHLVTGETVRDAANRVWAYLRGAWTAYREALDQLPAGAPTTSPTASRRKPSLRVLPEPTSVALTTLPRTSSSSSVAVTATSPS
jgi:hypothetical protein